MTFQTLLCQDRVSVIQRLTNTDLSSFAQYKGTIPAVFLHDIIENFANDQHLSYNY